MSGPADWRQRGWVKADNAVLHNPRLHRSAKLLYFTLTHFQGANEDSWHSQESLAEAIGIKSLPWLWTLTRELVAEGLLEVSRPDRRFTNHYRVRRPSLQKVGPSVDRTSDLLSTERKEDNREEEPMKKNDSNASPPKMSIAIAGVAADIGRELGDQAHEPSNMTQALHIWTESGLPEPEFIALLRAVKTQVRHAQAHGVQNKMAYFFAILRGEIAGLRTEV
jgi:hypothetical protein